MRVKINVYIYGHYDEKRIRLGIDFPKPFFDSPTERIITLRITSERITSERINTERITS